MIDCPHGSHTFGGAHPEGAGILRGELFQAVVGLGNGAANGRQDVRWQMGENRESFGFDLIADAEGLAQKDGGVRTFAALGFGANFGYEHGNCSGRFGSLRNEGATIESVSELLKHGETVFADRRDIASNADVATCAL